MLPKRQKAFGQGENGVFDSTNGYSWGPEVTGQSYTKWDGNNAKLLQKSEMRKDIVIELSYKGFG